MVAANPLVSKYKRMCTIWSLLSVEIEKSDHYSRIEFWIILVAVSIAVQMEMVWVETGNSGCTLIVR